LQRSSAAGKAAAQPNKKLPQASEHSDPNLIDSATETKTQISKFFSKLLEEPGNPESAKVQYVVWAVHH
jgi:hypothetical protein